MEQPTIAKWTLVLMEYYTLSSEEKKMFNESIASYKAKIEEEKEGTE